MHVHYLKLLLPCCAALALAVNGCGKKDAHQEHAGEQPGAHATETPDAHAGHGAGTTEEIEVTLTPQGVSFAQIKIDTVKQTRLGTVIELPGEIGLNEDQHAVVTPRYSGIAREVLKDLGAQVQTGEVLAIIENRDNLSTYELKAPMTGTIIEKHVVPGEFVNEEPIFIIANLSTVWGNCEVFAWDLPQIKVGQRVVVRAVGTTQETAGNISYIAPVLDQAKRSAIARVVIPSQNGAWRPGMFIQAVITVSSASAPLVCAVAAEAVQTIKEGRIVFVPENETTFRAVMVTTGRENGRYTEILTGLTSGEMYVSRGAFELKAKIVTSSLGGHAGHGH